MPICSVHSPRGSARLARGGSDDLLLNARGCEKQSGAERSPRFVAGLAPLELRRSVGRLVAVDPLR
jgi:hypothetical protein